jgi:tetratricopeptide (TPR) repeat protein
LQKIGPSWLLHTLAALYWRGHGRASNGIECFRQALSSVPDQHRHIPLTNLAALLLKMGQVNDALSLASVAHQINNREPKTNFLLGLLHLHFNNHSLAVRHFDRAIKIDHDSASEMEHYKLMAACHAVEKETAQHLQCQGVSFLTHSNHAIIFFFMKSSVVSSGFRIRHNVSNSFAL